MKIDQVQITVDGAPLDVEPTTADLVAFERHFDLPASSLEDEGVFRLEHVLYVAWHALKRTGRYDGDFDAFISSVEGIPNAA